MSLSGNQAVMRSAAVRAIELKSEFHREVLQAATAIAGNDNAITVQHIEKAVAHAAEQIARKYSGENESQADARSSAA